MSLLEGIALTSLVAWILVSMDRARRWPSELDLEALAATLEARSKAAEVVALVPARNEANCLTTTLPALLEQEGVELEVVLIDDESDDGTMEVAKSCARRLGRSDQLTVVEAPPLVQDQSGKVRALECGLESILSSRKSSNGSLPEWILLTDADILHRQGSVSDLVRLASVERAEGRLDLVSVMARLRAVTSWERLLIPPFVFFFQLLYPFRRVASRPSKVAAAAGGCILLRTSALLQAGGFAPIHDALIDDVALARRIKSIGGGLWLGFDSGIRSVRAYEGLSSLWRMVSRTAFTQLGFSSLLLILTLMTLTVVVVSPPLILAGSLLSLMLEETTNPQSYARAAIWAVLAWTIESSLLLPSVRHHGIGKLWATTLPVAGIFYGLMTLSSAWRYWLGWGAQWKGRNLGADREDATP